MRRRRACAFTLSRAAFSIGLDQVIEMVRLAEEARDVGGQRHEQALALFLALMRCGDQRDILTETAQPQRTQPLGQARIDQRGLRYQAR